MQKRKKEEESGQTIFCIQCTINYLSEIKNMDEMCTKREKIQDKLYKTTSGNDNKITKLTFGLSFYD